MDSIARNPFARDLIAGDSIVRDEVVTGMQLLGI
jgi:hypothetical protein